MDDTQVYAHLIKYLPKRRYQNRTVMISAPYMMTNIGAFIKFLNKDCGLDIIIATAQDRLEESDLLYYQGQYDVALIGDDRYTAKILDYNQRADGTDGSRKILGLCKWGTGIDSINQEAAARNGIRILD